MNCLSRHTSFRILVLLLCLALPVTGAAQRAYVSPYVRQAALLDGMGKRASGGKGMSRMPQLCRPRLITAFVRSTSREALEDEGCRVLATWGTLHIAQIPLTRIAPLSRRAGVMAIEAGRSCHALLDTTTVVTHARDLWGDWKGNKTEATATLTGRGVLVGMVDIGFDLTHPTFSDNDGNGSRILAFWDQLATPPLADDDGNLSIPTFETGTELPPHALDGLIMTHGTHTTGIAAGNGSEGDGRQSPYIGMAPEASLALVANFTGDNEALVADSLRYLYTTATDVLAFKYIFDEARRRGLPCVVNMSEGATDDFFDSRLAAEAIDSLTGPGRIIVASAGNEAWRKTYLRIAAGTGCDGAVIDGGGPVITLSRRACTATLRFHDKSAPTAAPLATWHSHAAPAQDSVYADTLAVGNRRYVVLSLTAPSCFDEQQVSTEMLVTTADTLDMDALITVEVAADAGGDTELFGHFTTHAAFPTLGRGLSNDHNILFPASAPSVIAVGGTAWRQRHVNFRGDTMTSDIGHDGLAMSYSSRGPTLAGLVKPDVAAPGANIVSAYSSYYAEGSPGNWDRNWDLRRFTFRGREYSWNSNSGTSMSSPAVAGIVAQWLQLCPTLSPTQLREVFAATCRRPDTSLLYPNNVYGHGEIDAEAGAEYIARNLTAISAPRLPQSPGTLYNIAGQRVTASYRGLVIENNRKRLTGSGRF